MSPLKFHFITVIIVPVRIPLRSVTGSRFRFIYGKKLHGPGPQHCLWLRMRQVLLTGAKPPSPSSSSLDSLSLAEKKSILTVDLVFNQILLILTQCVFSSVGDPNDFFRIRILFFRPIRIQIRLLSDLDLNPNRFGFVLGCESKLTLKTKNNFKISIFV